MKVALLAFASLAVSVARAGQPVVLISDSAERPYALTETTCASGQSDLRVELSGRDGALTLVFRDLVPRLGALKAGEPLELPFEHDAEIGVRFIDRQADAWRFARERYRSRCRFVFEKRSAGLVIHGDCGKLRPKSDDGFTLGFEIPAESPIECLTP